MSIDMARTFAMSWAMSPASSRQPPSSIVCRCWHPSLVCRSSVSAVVAKSIRRRHQNGLAIKPEPKLTMSFPSVACRPSLIHRPSVSAVVAKSIRRCHWNGLAIKPELKLTTLFLSVTCRPSPIVHRPLPVGVVGLLFVVHWHWHWRWGLACPVCECRCRRQRQRRPSQSA